MAARTFTSGQNTDVDTAAEVLTSSSVGCTVGVLLKALSTNTGIIYVGGSAVTTSDGYPLSAGEDMFLSVEDLDDIYVIADGADQAIAFIAY